MIDHFHGSFSLYCQPGLLLGQLQDAWNAATAKHFTQRCIELAPQYHATKPWTLVLDLRPWNFITPDAVASFREAIDWSINHHLQRTIYLSGRSPLGDFFLKQMHPEGVPEGISFFHTADYMQALQKLADWQIQLPETQIALLENVEVSDFN